MQNKYWMTTLFLLIAALLGACGGPSEEAPQVEQTPPPTAVEQAPSPTEEAPIIGGDEVINPRYKEELVIKGIKEAIMQRDTEAMAQLMGDPFTIGRWQSEGQSLTPGEATTELTMGWIIPGNPLSFVDDADLPAMLGMDPLTMWGPDVDVRSTFLALGWGSNATSEAIIIIAYQDDIGYYWHAVLIAPEGFVTQADNMTLWQQFETEVKRAITERDLETMQSFMSDPFEIALWQSSGTTLSPEEAIQQIDSYYPPEGGLIDFSVQPDLQPLLGQSPFEFFAGGISFFHSTGWNEDGLGEAIIVFGADEAGTFRWTKILFAPSGF